MKKIYFNKLFLVIILLFMFSFTSDTVFSKDLELEEVKIYSNAKSIPLTIRKNNQKFFLYHLKRIGDNKYNVLYKHIKEKQCNSYEKLVRKEYKSGEKISTVLSYSEYNTRYDTIFSGNLKLVSLEKNNQAYIVKYKGNIKNKYKEE